MKNQYIFNSYQVKELNELLSPRYTSMWSSVMYGISSGNLDIVKIALAKVGNVGGEKFWRWYGFNQRVEWCVNQAGYIETNTIPKFSFCRDAVSWFKPMGEWRDNSYIPKPGDIIFFDWEVDGVVNHVGIVEKVDKNRFFTVEGNSLNDMCRQREYKINDKVIFGYGVPIYEK